MTLKLLILLLSHLVSCSARKVVNRPIDEQTCAHTHKPNQVTLDGHACRELPNKQLQKVKGWFDSCAVISDSFLKC